MERRSSVYFLSSAFCVPTSILLLNIWYRAILPVILTWMVLEAIGAYNPDIDMRSLPYTSQYILAVMIIVVLTIVVVYIFSYKPSLQFSRSVLPATFFVFLIISLSVRRTINSRLAEVRRKRFYLVLGTDETAQELYRMYAETPKDQEVRFADLSGKKVGIIDLWKRLAHHRRGRSQ